MIWGDYRQISALVGSGVEVLLDEMELKICFKSRKNRPPKIYSYAYTRHIGVN